MTGVSQWKSAAGYLAMHLRDNSTARQFAHLLFLYSEEAYASDQVLVGEALREELANGTAAFRAEVEAAFEANRAEWEAMRDRWRQRDAEFGGSLEHGGQSISVSPAVR